MNRFVNPICSSFLLLSSLLVVAGSGCNTPEKEKEPEIAVQVTPVRKTPIEETVTAEGVVSPLYQAIVTPKITSTIKEFRVQRGSKVRKGQLLAILENADLSAAAQQSKGEYEQAQAGYSTATGATLPQEIQKAELDASTAKAGLDAQQKIFDSRNELFEQGALPRRDLDAAQVALAQARSQSEVANRQLADLKRIGEKDALKSATGQLEAAQGKFRGAAAQLSYSEIRSPIDGVVTDRPQFAGELATANQSLITVMDTTKLIAKSHIAQAQAAQLKVGNSAEIRVAGSEEPIASRVTLVSPALDPGSTTIEVWVEARKPNAALRPGMTVQLSIVERSAKDALVVPTESLYKNDDGQDYLAVAGTNGRAQLKTVQVGIRTPQLIQITSGVKAGDPVITSGGYALPDKAKIKVQAVADKNSNEKSDGDTGGAAKDKE